MIAINEKANRTKVLAAVAVLAMVACVFVAMPVDETDAAGNDITYVSGVIDKEMTFTDGNKVVVDKNLTITNGAELIIGYGAQFTVNEGVTVTVGSSTAAGTISISPNADVNVNGAIVINEKGTIAAGTDGTPEDKKFVPGFNVDGTMTVQSGAVINYDGTITVGTAGTVTTTSIGTKISKITGATIDLMPGATLSVRGIVGITVNSISANADNKALSATAVLSQDGTPETTATSAKVTNLTFTAASETVTAYTTGDNGVTRSQIDITTLSVSGTVQNGDKLTLTSEADSYYADREMKEATPITSKVVVSETLTVGKLGIIAVNGEALVSGTVSVTANKTEDAVVPSISIGADGVVTVTGTVSFNGESYVTGANTGSLKVQGGTVTISNCAEPTGLGIGELYGAYYVDVDEVTHIMDLNAAINAAAADNTIDSISVYAGKDSATTKDYEGGYVVAESFSVPSNVTLYVYTALIIPEDVTVTVPVDAIMDINGIVDVNGKLIDSSLTALAANIDSEVTISSDEGATITYTSLKIAIAEAESGSTITLAGEAKVEGELTIPAGITVDVGDFSITVANDSKLIVDGVLVADTENSIVTTPANEDENKTAGVVTVNNIIVRNVNDVYNETDYDISGVYVTGEIADMDGMYFIVPMGVLEANAANIDYAEVYGTVSCGDVALTSESDLVLTVVGKLTAGTVTIDGCSVSIENGAVFNGTIANAEGSVAFTNVKAGTDGIEVTDTTYDEADRLTVAGDIAADTDSKGVALKASIAIASGTVYAGALNFTVQDATLTIPEGTSVYATGAITGVDSVTVEGELTVQANITISIVNITGTVAVAEGYALGAADAYVGMTADDVKKGNATSTTAAVIEGTVDFDTIYAAPGAELSVDNMESVEFYVEDALWMTVYSSVENKTITVDKAPVQNAVFENWTNADEEDLGYNVAINGDYESVTAVVDYEIYDIMVVADNGVGTVAIDGVVLMKSSNVFVAYGLTAGSHTISIDVKNGYSADNVVIQVNGQTVTGDTFTLSGTPEAGNNTVEVTITVSGTAVADTVVVEEDGMGVTDYLLIILVVLVIVLAIVVVMRMMRS